MHSKIMVYGPTTDSELEKLMDRFGENASIKQKRLSDLSSHPLDITFRAFHEIVKERLQRPYPKYVVVSKTHAEYMELRELYAGDIDIIVTYDDTGLGEMRYLYSEQYYDWYMVGGRWYNHLIVKPELAETTSDFIEAHKSFAVEIAEDDPLAFNSVEMKSVDWSKMVERNQKIYLSQFNLLKHAGSYDDIKPFDFFVDKHGVVNKVGFYDMTQVYDDFYKQLNGRKIPSDIWGIFTVLGKTETQIMEFAELLTYSGTRAIINGEWSEVETVAGLYDIEAMRAIKEKVLALDPSTVVTVLDIHN
jgi:hypothetical protein